MFQFLFILSLFLIVWIALDLEIFLIPNILSIVLGGCILLFGILFAVFGNLRRTSAPPPVAGKPQTALGCLPVLVGGMYALIGVGILILQSIGRFAIQ